jgi:molybdate transport system regulatory protein
MPRLSIHIRFDYGSLLGPGEAALLEAIAREGSMSAAGRSMSLSCTRAWKLLAQINRAFDATLVATEIDGRSGGRTALTERGEEIVRHYRAIEREARLATAPRLKALQSLFRQSRRSQGVARSAGRRLHHDQVLR